MKNKKTKIAIIAVIALVLVTVGITYAYWLITRTQTKTNVIGAGCLDISLTDEQNDISLQNQFPLSDEEGMKLTPYTFTVTNNCNTSVDYQLNLELLGDSTNSLAATSIRVGLNDNSFILGNKDTRETTVEGAYESYQLMYGRLEAKGNEGSSDTHNLRLWLDKEAPIEEMNKTLETKITLRAGQGIENPYNEGTIAFNMVGNAGGTGYITELIADLKSIASGNSLDVVFEKSAYYYWGTDYKLDPETGYILSGDVIRATVLECRATEGLCGKYTLQNKDNANTSSFVLYEVISLKDDNSNFGGSYTYITTKKISASNDFSEVNNETYAKLHQVEDNYGTSYYYRGNVNNNYVKFGTWSEDKVEIRGYGSGTSTAYEVYDSIEECNAASSHNYNCTEIPIARKGDPMYWRIIRANGDGTIRIIYDGTEAIANGINHTAIISTAKYTVKFDDIKYAGYTYENADGIQENSIIKGIIDTWYESNLKTDYDKYIADSGFCNDVTSRNGGDGYTYYGAYDRIYLRKKPQLNCNNNNYTINTEYGNGYLTNPVGLITADEVAYAGGTIANTNLTYYLYNANQDYWTISPSNLLTAAAGHFPEIYYVDAMGKISEYSGKNLKGVRPVLNLKTDVEFIGNGTIDSPYEIVMN